MRIDRRTMMAGGVALAAAPALAKAKAAKADWYDQAIVIDALGGVGDPYAPKEEQLRLTDRAWSEMVETGVTMLRDTVFPVGNGTDPWGDYTRDIALKQNLLNANPDRLLLVRTAADILKAKREKKFAWLYGTQDTSMVGPELDRLAQLKKDGVMTVQLTYNNRNLAGDGALEPANASYEVRILPPIPAGMDPDAFLAHLIDVMETASDRLLLETVDANPHLPLPPTAAQRVAELRTRGA